MYTVGNNDGDCTIEIVLKENSICYMDFDGNICDDIPLLKFGDEQYQERWDLFIGEIKKIHNINEILSSLESGEGVQVGDLIFYLD